MWKRGHRRGAIGATRLLTILSLTNSFDGLARFYGTDKSSRGNNYATHYRHHLGSRRFRKNVVVEIGIGGYDRAHGGGGSLRALRDYMPRSRIVGFDIHPKDLPYLGHRVHVMQGDQSSPDDLGRIIDRFGSPDVVIDDGSHLGTHVIASFQYLFDRMAPGGIYAIEDLFFSYHEAFGGTKNPGRESAMGLLDELMHSAQRVTASTARRLKVDPAFPHLDRAGRIGIGTVASVHVYPGIAFIEKVGRR
jgi:23S rRNA U2552 (ribose-2'-O)-methylase RlmE/FtsJ